MLSQECSPADFLQVSPPTALSSLLATVRNGWEKPVHEGSLCVQLWVSFFHSPLSGEKLALGSCPVPGVTAETWLLSKRHKVAQEL